MIIDINQYVPISYAYIDPGTGSMLFTIIISLVSAGIFAIRGIIIKLRYSFSKDKSKINNSKIAFAIYAESKRYWTIFEQICDEFEKNKKEVLYLTSSKDDPVFNKNYYYIKPEYIGEGNSSFAKLNMLNADIVLSSTPSLDVYQWKRSKNVKYYIHIPHMANDITTYKMFGIDYYDAILTANDFQIKQIRDLESIRGLSPKDIRTVGFIPFDSMKKRLDLVKKTNNDIPVVLLAPSWGESSILNRYGSSIIDELINTGYKIIIRPHPQSYSSEKEMLEKLIKKYPNIEWNNDNDNFDVLNKADILISDFSGVIFDYTLVFDKPIIYADTSFDKSPYDAYWLDEDMWTFKVLPDLGIELNKNNFENIKELIDKCMKDDKFKYGRAKVREEAWKNQNNASRDIVQYMLDKHDDMTKE